MSEPPIPVSATNSVTESPAVSSVAPVPTTRPEPVAPADLAPVPTRRERFVWYAGSMILASVLVTAGLRLDSQDLHAPFYYDLDSLLYLPLAKNIVENGTHWHNDRMGAPGVQELYDFPIIDYLHFGLLWLFSRVTPDLLVAYNIYNLLTYPLTVLTGMFVLRWLKLSLPAAAVGGLLYAFLPYHQERYQYHYFLAAYWVVPLSLMPALALCRGEFPLYPLQPDGTRRRRFTSFSALWPLALGALTASAGAYYAFFACATYAFSGVYASLLARTSRGVISAAWVVAPVVAVGVAFHYPTVVYQSRYGANPITDRWPEEAETYGLKLAHLLLPANDHNLTIFSQLRTLYSTPSRPVDSESAGALGVVGGSGLVALLVMAVLPHRRRWPEGPLVGLVLFLVLLATVGGFGSLFNLLVSAQIRAYNRISVFIGFLCLFAALWWLDRYLLTHTGRWSIIRWKYIIWSLPLPPLIGTIVVAVLGAVGVIDHESLGSLLPVLAAALALSVVVSGGIVAGTLYFTSRRAGAWCHRVLESATLPARYPALAAVFLIGFLDQTPYSWFKQKVITVTNQHAERFRTDRQFFQEIEERSPNARVFCLPYIAFPESPPVQKMQAYEHARGYLMTDTPTWSFGAIKRREADCWQREVSFEKPNEFLRRVVVRGFDGLFIDGRGYLPRRVEPGKTEPVSVVNPRERVHAIYADLVKQSAARLPEVVHSDGKQFFLDLRPYRDAYQRLVGAEEFERQARVERELIVPLWLKGFSLDEPFYDGELLLWGSYTSTLVLVNPTDRTRSVDLTFQVGVDVVGEYHFSVSGLPGLTNGAFEVEKPHEDDSQNRSRHMQSQLLRAELPPGRTTVRIRCTPPPWYFPGDHWKRCYFIQNFHIQER